MSKDGLRPEWAFFSRKSVNNSIKIYISLSESTLCYDLLVASTLDRDTVQDFACFSIVACQLLNVFILFRLDYFGRSQQA